MSFIDDYGLANMHMTSAGWVLVSAPTRDYQFMMCCNRIPPAVLGFATIVACWSGGNPRNDAGTPDFEHAKFSISPAATTTIGSNSSDPAHELAGIQSAALTASGNILVIAHQTPEVWLFDRNGKYLRSVGTKGDGPGEFRHATSVTALGDGGFMVYDDGHRRVTRFDSVGKMMKTWEQVPNAKCCFNDGAFIFEPEAPLGFSLVDPDPRDTSSALISFALVSPGDEAVKRASIISLPHTKNGIAVMQPGYRGRNIYPRPFERLTSVVIAGDKIIHGTASSFTYSVYSRDGNAVSRVSVPHDQKKVSSAQLSEMGATFVADAEEGEMKAKHAQIFAAIPHHATEPAYAEIMAEEDGTVWVHRYESDYRSSNWWVRFAKDGLMSGTIKLPDHWRVERFTRGHVLLSRTNDSTGVTTLLVHSIVPLN